MLINKNIKLLLVITNSNYLKLKLITLISTIVISTYINNIIINRARVT